MAKTFSIQFVLLYFNIIEQGFWYKIFKHPTPGSLQSSSKALPVQFGVSTKDDHRPRIRCSSKWTSPVWITASGAIVLWQDFRGGLRSNSARDRAYVIFFFTTGVIYFRLRLSLSGYKSSTLSSPKEFFAPRSIFQPQIMFWNLTSLI